MITGGKAVIDERFRELSLEDFAYICEANNSLIVLLNIEALCQSNRVRKFDLTEAKL